MKNLVKLAVPLMALLLCSSQCEKEEEVPVGYTMETINCIGSHQFAQLCSGDYACVQGGKHFKVGDTSRVGGNWNAPPCPTIVTTTDGAKWQFQGNCSCP